MKLLSVLIVLFLLVSCEKENLVADALGSNASIIGTWVEDSFSGDTVLLYRAGELDPDAYGFSIKNDGTFIERKNSGFCGTPPIAYDNFEGSWKAVSDSLLDITVDFWGGVMTFQMRIISVDAEELAIRYLYSENRTDSR